MDADTTTLRPETVDAAAAVATVLDVPLAMVGPRVLAELRWQFDGRLLLPRVRQGTVMEAAGEPIERAAEAWEALCARLSLPPAWLQDPGRLFVDDAGHRHVAPPTVRAAVTVATRWRAMARAEDLAREAAARLASWTPPSFSRSSLDEVEWVLDEPGGRPLFPDLTPWGVCFKVVVASVLARRDRGAPVALGSAPLTRWSAQRARCAALAAAWHAMPPRARAPARVLGSRVPAAGRRFAELPDPFAPVLAIWKLGFVLQGVAWPRPRLICPLF